MSSAQHRKPTRLAADRVKAAARHRKPSPLAAALQQKPARFAAAMAGSVLVASIGSPAAHWAGAESHLLTSAQAEAMSTLGTAAGSAAGAPAKDLPVTGHRSAVLPQSGLGQPGRSPRSPQRSAPQPSAPQRLRPGSQPQTTAQPVYRNPLRAVSGLLAERVDEGVDFGGSGPVYALGDAVVTNATGSDYGWPGGGWITYRLTDGPAAGLVVYVAEDVAPSVSVGEHVTSSTVIGDMFDGGDGIETGWAMPDGSTAESQAPAAGGIGGSGPYPTAIGMDFEALLESVGVPAGNNAGVAASGLVPSGYPTTWP